MNTPLHTPMLLTAVFIGLILWRLYMRLRRAVGRQHLTPIRPWIAVILYPLLMGLLAMSAAPQPLALAAFLASAAVGAGLGIWALTLTRFEVTPQGLYYTPNAHIGIALALIFLGRIAFRMLTAGSALMAAGANDGGGLPPVPILTLVTFGPLAGYYMAYSIGLLRWRGRVAAQQAQGTAAS
jgi:hypothetical protein